MQGWDQVGHCNVCEPMTKWDTLMCDPPPILIIILINFEKKMIMEDSFAQQINKDATHIITQIEYGSDIYIEIIYTGTSLP